MNSCGRVGRSPCLRPLLSRLFPRCDLPWGTGPTALCLRLGHATAAGEKPRPTAADLARKIRQEKEQQRQQDRRGVGSDQSTSSGPGSAQQRRVEELRRFSQQLQRVHPNVLAKHLHRGVLFQDEEVVVVNKPLGVPVRDDCGGTSISSVLPVLSKMMDGMKVKSSSQLLLCLGLEKEMSGVLLLSRSEEAVHRIQELQRQNQVQRKFWVVTVGVPVPSEGVIDIPVVERAVTGARPHYKMALSPLYRMNGAGDGLTRTRAHGQAHSAATQYRVLDSGVGYSLVELQPLTAVKHQLRVHMALALGCPILGDHKYSHPDKLAPQKLPECILGKLGLEQSKVRHIPLHVHARQLTLQQEGRADIVVSCPLPKYFTQTLKRLFLTLPDKKEKLT